MQDRLFFTELYHLAPFSFQAHAGTTVLFYIELMPYITKKSKKESVAIAMKETSEFMDSIYMKLFKAIVFFFCLML